MVPERRCCPRQCLASPLCGRHGVLAQTEREAREAWERLQGQFAALHLVVNQEKSRLTTLREGFAFLGFDVLATAAPS